jgi:hypothetical protein
MQINMTGTNVGLSNSGASGEWDATGQWFASAVSSFGNKINMFKYDSTTQTMTLPTVGAAGPPNNWSSFKTDCEFHPTEQLLFGFGEVATYLESCYYTGTGNIWTKHVGNFDAQPNNNCFCGRWNRQGTHLMSGQANLGGGLPSFYLFLKSGTGSGVTFTRQTGAFDVVPGSTASDSGYDICYNPVYDYVAMIIRMGTGEGKLTGYSYSGNSYTQRVANAFSPTGLVIGASGQKRMCAWSKDGLYLYVGNNSAGTAPQLRAFSFNPGTFALTQMDVTEAELLCADAGAIAVSPDNKYLFVHGGGTGAIIFKREISTGALTLQKYLATNQKENDAVSGSDNIYVMSFGKQLYTPYESKHFERYSVNGIRGNPTAIYQFNEVSGNIIDTAGGSATLNTFIGTPVYGAAGKRSAASAITFSGSQFVYRTGQLTGATETRGAVFCVIKPNVIAGSQRNLFSQGNSAVAANFAEIFITSAGELGWRSSISAGNTAEKITSGLGLTSGQWYSILVRQEWKGAGSPRFWINGVEWRGTFTTATAGTGQLWDWFSASAGSMNRNGFGARVTTTNTNFFSGDLDDLLIFGAPGPSNNGLPDDLSIKTMNKYALGIPLPDTYSSAMQSYYPIHYNRLNDPSVAVISMRDDYRGLPPTPAGGGGTWIGDSTTVSPTLRDTDAPLTGQQSFSMLFNGTTQMLCPLTADSIPSAARTGSMIAWFKGIPGTAGFIYGSWTDTLQQGMGIRVDATGSVTWVLRRSGGAANEITMQTNNTFGSGWHMVCVTSDNVNNNIVYVDGVAQAVTTTTAGTATAKDWWSDITAAGTWRPTIGARRSAASTIADPYAGRVSECAITNRNMFASEVLDLYNKRAA